MEQASRSQKDRRGINEVENTKRQKLDHEGQEGEAGGDALAEVRKKVSVLPEPFSEVEIAAEERRPKYKVAVMLGYSGTGYHGMQM